MQQLKAFIEQWFEDRRARRITYENARQRVRRGAAYLDDVDPDWYRQVDVATLELSSGGQCVLGQLHGDFALGLTRARLLDLSSAPRANLSPVSFGFHCVYGVGEELQQQDYDYLTRAWQEAIWLRQQQDVEGEGLPQAVHLPKQQETDSAAHAPVHSA